MVLGTDKYLVLGRKVQALRPFETSFEGSVYLIHRFLSIVSQ